MPRVLFDVYVWRVVPEHVADDAQAVRAGPDFHADDETENMVTTRAEIDDHDIRPLSTFAIGTRVYVEGEERENLDDTDETGGSRIWWRCTVVGILAPGGSA